MAKDEKCGNPTPTSAKNAGCSKDSSHKDNHSNGFSVWTQKQGKSKG